MPSLSVRHRRLFNQHLIGPPLGSPEEVVRWLGAVQSQDYPGGKWAVAQRTKGVVDADLDRAFNDGRILRTHVMRPTWHFVMPEDIRWLLALTGPRVHKVAGSYYRRYGIDGALITKARRAIEK